MVKRFGFGKEEKLTSQRQIDDLFANGKKLSVFPITVSYQFFVNGELVVLKTGVTAPKKNFKKAVDRNKIKRMLRESYRLQKAVLLQAMKDRGCNGRVFFIYSDKTIHSFESILEAMKQCLIRLQQKLPT